MTTPEAGAPTSGTLDDWMAALAAELGLGPGPYDVTGLLDVARDVAHGVTRPAAPVSLFLVGLAAERAGGSESAVADACARAAALALRWGGPAGPTPGGAE